jgi:hypothetical protein
MIKAIRAGRQERRKSKGLMLFYVLDLAGVLNYEQLLGADVELRFASLVLDQKPESGFHVKGDNHSHTANTAAKTSGDDDQNSSCRLTRAYIIAHVFLPYALLPTFLSGAFSLVSTK